VLVIDDSGDRKDGTKTAHVGHQYLGRYGKTDNGVVTVTAVWADERVYYPVHAVPYTPARHFAKGKNDPGFRTKLAIGADLAVRAREAGFRSGPWPPTAPTGIRTGSAASWPRPGCRS
jgi:SRSO17 transposase